MLKVTTYRDPGKQRELWETLWPQQCLFDLWPVRCCFNEEYGRSSDFITAEDGNAAVGLLPLCWIEEQGCYGFFPGELCAGITWLEQNKIPSRDPHIAGVLLESVTKPLHLKYLIPEYLSGLDADSDTYVRTAGDTGYIFYPGRYNFSFEKYFEAFSGRSRKKIASEISLLQRRGMTFRLGHFSDIDKLFEMNIRTFGERSYFYDRRFLRSFIKLAEWLNRSGLIRITTMLIGGKVAACDIAAIWNSQYTVLAGGTDPEFPGVAKAINFRHMKWACEERVSSADFLCGDFGWKGRFHLTPRPFSSLSSLPEEALPMGSTF